MLFCGFKRTPGRTPCRAFFLGRKSMVHFLTAQILFSLVEFHYTYDSQHVYTNILSLRFLRYFIIFSDILLIYFLNNLLFITIYIFCFIFHYFSNILFSYIFNYYIYYFIYYYFFTTIFFFNFSLVIVFLFTFSY